MATPLPPLRRTTLLLLGRPTCATSPLRSTPARPPCASCRHPRQRRAPIFEPRTRAYLGVVELIMTTQKINYNVEIQNICIALKGRPVSASLRFDSPIQGTLCRLHCFALNLFDEMTLGKYVITTGHSNP
jgi:hypothetical protein